MKYKVTCYVKGEEVPLYCDQCDTMEEVVKTVKGYPQRGGIEVIIESIEAKIEEPVHITPSFKKATLSGQPPCEDYKGPAPCPIDDTTGMHKDYWVLPEEDRARGFVRPVRLTYIHEKCSASTRMNRAIAETYAANPRYYGATFCSRCGNHYPVGENGEFVWEDGSKVGT